MASPSQERGTTRISSLPPRPAAVAMSSGVLSCTMDCSSMAATPGRTSSNRACRGRATTQLIRVWSAPDGEGASETRATKAVRGSPEETGTGAVPHELERAALRQTTPRGQPESITVREWERAGTPVGSPAVGGVARWWQRRRGAEARAEYGSRGGAGEHVRRVRTPVRRGLPSRLPGKDNTDARRRTRQAASGLSRGADNATARLARSDERSPADNVQSAAYRTARLPTSAWRRSQPITHAHRIHLHAVYMKWLPSIYSSHWAKRSMRKAERDREVNALTVSFFGAFRTPRPRFRVIKKSA